MARSQYYGGMIRGISFALREQSIVDPRRPMNANLAEYHVPVNADVPSLEAILIQEHDPHVNALGIKGVGEIGITGTAGAVANAIWHATGSRAQIADHAGSLHRESIAKRNLRILASSRPGISWRAPSARELSNQDHVATLLHRPHLRSLRRYAVF
jgi:hypothetical protein